MWYSTSKASRPEEEVGDLDQHRPLGAAGVPAHERPVEPGQPESALSLEGDLAHALVVDLELGDDAVLRDVSAQCPEGRVDGRDDRRRALADGHVGVESQPRPPRQPRRLAALGDVPHARRDLDRVPGLDRDAAERVVQRHAAEGVRILLLRLREADLREQVLLHRNAEVREDARRRLRVLDGPRPHDVLVAALAEDVLLLRVPHRLLDLLAGEPHGALRARAVEARGQEQLQGRLVGPVGEAVVARHGRLSVEVDVVLLDQRAHVLIEHGVEVRLLHALAVRGPLDHIPEGDHFLHSFRQCETGSCPRLPRTTR